MELERFLRAKRAEHGWSQDYVSKQLGTHPAMYSRKERGLSQFSEKEKKILGQMLELNYSEVNHYLYNDGIEWVIELWRKQSENDK